MRFEICEILLDDTISVILSTSSRDYAERYLRFMQYRYGDYREFYLRDNKGVKSYEKKFVV